jgi:hypothetical protein
MHAVYRRRRGEAANAALPAIPLDFLAERLGEQRPPHQMTFSIARPLPAG